MKFSEWLHQQDIELARWEYRELEPLTDGTDDHDHVLVPYTPEETDIIIERYLRNVRKIYGDMPAAHMCTFGCTESQFHPGLSPEALENVRQHLEEIRKNKPL